MPKLERLGVQDFILDRLQTSDPPIVTGEEFLEKDPSQLASLLNLSLQEIQALRIKISCNILGIKEDLLVAPSEKVSQSEAFGKICSQSSTPLLPFLDGADVLAAHLALNETYFSTGSSSLDTLLGNGVQPYRITELVGTQGVGKTQICLTTAVLAAMKGAHVVFIDTSNSADPRRLLEIAQNRCHRQLQDIDHVLQAIEIRKAWDIFQLFDTLNPVSMLSNNNKPLLVIVDSVACCLSPLMSGSDSRLISTSQVYGLMSTLAHMLANCSTNLGAAVLVTNNTVQDWDGPENAIKGALGISWTYAVNARVAIRERAEGILEAILLKHPCKAVGFHSYAKHFTVDGHGCNDIIVEGFYSEESF